MSVSLILLALCNWPNPFRHPYTKSHWLCRHYWHHHRPALDPSELFHHYWLPDNGSNVRRELANFSRYGGRICWLLHDSWLGAGRGLWHQYLHCYRGGEKQADHTHNANTSWWFNSFTPSVGRAWVLIWSERIDEGTLTDLLLMHMYISEMFHINLYAIVNLFLFNYTLFFLC